MKKYFRFFSPMIFCSFGSWGHARDGAAPQALYHIHAISTPVPSLLLHCGLW